MIVAAWLLRMSASATSDLRVADELDAKRADKLDFRFDEITREAVFGNADG